MPFTAGRLPEITYTSERNSAENCTGHGCLPAPYVPRRPARRAAAAGCAWLCAVRAGAAVAQRYADAGPVHSMGGRPVSISSGSSPAGRGSTIS